MLGGVAIIASIIGTFFVRTRTGNVERALYKGLIASGVIAAAAFYPVTYWLMGTRSATEAPAAPVRRRASASSTSAR